MEKRPRRALCEEALTVCEEVEDARTEALALLRLGWMHFQRGAYREARTLVDRGLSRARAARDARTEAKALGILACLDHAAGENERSRRGYEAAIAIAREHGDSILEATQQTNMAEDLRDRGELDASRVAFEAALAIRSRLGDAYNGPITLAEYAALVHLSGDRREALAVFARAEAGLRAIPHRYQLAMLLSNRATLEAAHDADRSRADIAETEAILRDLGASDDSAPARRLRGARAALEG